MTTPNRRRRLALELLERRDCPTLNVIYTGGSLFLLGRPATTGTAFRDGVYVTQNSSEGALTVTEVQGGTTVKNYGTYIVRKNLYLGLTDYDTDISIDTNGFRLPANIF